ncbi:MAG: nicotinate-nucleotide--dimethylbenzimidazole phosphoribosyltransferase [Opitutaceae bacterium]|jgi:nicotinate-nucleotide--dimethylbenzimidazole phosphoribosyltransferase
MIPVIWTVPSIPSLAHELEPALRARIANKTKPTGSLGRLEEIALRLGLMQATTTPKLVAPTVLIFAGDHGFAREGVSPFPPEVTPQMVLNILAGGAGINVLARLSNLPVKVIDAGVASDLPDHPDLFKLKVRPGTRNALYEDALTPAEVELCLQRGTEIVRLLSAAGVARKLDILTRVQRNRPAVTHPLDALAAYGGCEIAMMTGAMLEAVARCSNSTCASARRPARPWPGLSFAPPWPSSTRRPPSSPPA